MPMYPTLSKKPTYPLSEEREDNTIKSRFESGYQKTRSRYTRVRRKFQIKYMNLGSVDTALLDAFIDTVDGATDSFTWTHPVTGTSYTVRFEAPPKKSNTGYDGAQYLSDYDFVLVTL